ncbi:N-acylneuraminate cytidylyltransferase A [Drosophila busckii]|uniref:N-acylneuraminate cytidylyltransferase A n=1 Tax=Drosophila busckii TaxID=30019 RepID=UPI001432D084|nr:N-acylneuraminate cytidylyltransferase A [Drosophila busckii]
MSNNENCDNPTSEAALQRRANIAPTVVYDFTNFAGRAVQHDSVQLHILRRTGGAALQRRANIAPTVVYDFTNFAGRAVQHDSVQLHILSQNWRNGAIVHHRPAEYAMDNTSSVDAVDEFLKKHEIIQSFALFQCTSIFLKEKYIVEAVKKFNSHDCVFAVKRSFNLRWDFVNNKLLPVNFNIKYRPRRQDWNGDIVETGMFYFSRKSLVMDGILQNDKCAIVEIPSEDSLEIDSPLDLIVARCIVTKK